MDVEKLISGFWQSNEDWIFLAGMLILVVCAVIQLHKITKMSRKLKAVVEEVDNYLTVIMEEEVCEEKPGRTKEGTAPFARAANSGRNGASETVKDADMPQKREWEEEQNCLVASVLQEIFP